MHRRDFLALTSAATAFPRTALAQRAQAKRLGVMNNLTESDPLSRERRDLIWEGVGKQGWTDRNLIVDWRWGATTLDLAANFAAELVALQPDVLYGTPAPATNAFASL